MEAHRQTCQSCGGRDMRNIIVRAEGQRQVVLVRCIGCQQLVARYELASYYHHGKSYEAHLRNVAVATESAIELRDAYARAQAQAPRELEEAVAFLEARGKQV